MSDKELSDAFQRLLQRIASENGFSNMSVHVAADTDRAVTVYGHYGERQCVQAFGRTIAQTIKAAICQRNDKTLPFQEAA